VIAPRVHHQVILAHETLEEVSRAAGDNRFSTFAEHVVTSYHVGCHLDGLGHAGIDGRYYNGLHYSQIFAAAGLTQLGTENTRPWVGSAASAPFLFVLGVPRLQGATAAVVAPLAVL
jgi:hypothetical protein